MWTCPKCGHDFVNRNQSHSCGNFTFDEFVEGKTAKAISPFNHFLGEYRKIAKFNIHPVKTRVALLTKMRFCSINKLGEDFIDVHFVLTSPYSRASCFHRIDNLGDRFFVHHLRIHKKSDVTPQVREVMKFAYDVGNRKHVNAKTLPRNC